MHGNVDDRYCLVVKRYGALGILEGSFHNHITTEDQVQQQIVNHLKTLGPGDRCEITMTRGQQQSG